MLSQASISSAGGSLVAEITTPDTEPISISITVLLLDILFRGLEWLHAQELVRDVHEGEFHHGAGAVVQLIGRKL